VLAPQAALGSARALELQGQLQQAERQLAEAAVRSPWFPPLLAERARLLVALGDWEGALEAAAQVLQDNAADISAMTTTGERPVP
jgi:tetratricopeptide (TPR) repeat protein